MLGGSRPLGITNNITFLFLPLRLQQVLKTSLVFGGVKDLWQALQLGMQPVTPLKRRLFKD